MLASTASVIVMLRDGTSAGMHTPSQLRLSCCSMQLLACCHMRVGQDNDRSYIEPRCLELCASYADHAIMLRCSATSQRLHGDLDLYSCYWHHPEQQGRTRQDATDGRHQSCLFADIKWPNICASNMPQCMHCSVLRPKSGRHSRAGCIAAWSCGRRIKRTRSLCRDGHSRGRQIYDRRWRCRRHTCMSISLAQQAGQAQRCTCQAHV